MANPAFPRPDMSGPQPVAAAKVTANAAESRPLLRASGGESSDRVFQSAITACGLAVLGVLGLIVYELVVRSTLSWHAFGFKFFASSE
jgi:ABC-type phosphate transport system permease subunit